MRIVDIAAAALGCATVFVAGCAERPASFVYSLQNAGGEGATRIEAGDGAAKRLQAALISAKVRT